MIVKMWMHATHAQQNLKMEACDAKFQGGLIHHFNYAQVNSFQKTMIVDF